MTDEELALLVEDAIASLVKVHRALVARLDGVCLHEGKVSVATFANPDGFMCPDCGVSG